MVAFERVEGGSEADGASGPQQAGKLAALACVAYLYLRLSQPDDALQSAQHIVQAQPPPRHLFEISI